MTIGPELIVQLVLLVVLIFSITVHEFAHAYSANRLGDPTPKLAGRLTLNPLAHADMFGSVLFPLFLFLSGSPVFFAWAKPVPIDPFNFRNPNKDQAIVAFAGPLSNFLLAILFSLVAWLTNKHLGYLPGVLLAGATLTNLFLGFFNLLPVGPLDGAKVFLGLVPAHKSAEWQEAMARYGLVILILLILPIGGTSLIFRIINPVVSTIFSLIFPVALVFP